MPSLTIGGTNISVARRDIDHTYTEVGGDRARMLDGVMRETVRARKSTWPLETRLLTSATRDTVLGLLTGTPPLSATGDIFAPTTTPVDVFAQIDGVTRVPVRGGLRYRIRFTLHEK